MFYEFYLLAALLLISVAVGVGYYREHGIGGAFLAAGITFVGVVLAGACLLAMVSAVGRMEGRFQGQRWYRWAAKVGRILALLCFFSLFGAAICGAVLLRLDVPVQFQGLFVEIGAVIIGAVVTAIRLLVKDGFWPAFGRLCLFLSMSVVGAVMGLVVAQWLPQSPSVAMYLVDAGTLIPMGIYLFLVLRRRRKHEPKGPESIGGSGSNTIL